MPIFRQKRQKFATQSLPKHNKTGEIAVNFSRFSISDMPKPLKVSPRHSFGRSPSHGLIQVRFCH